MSRVAKNPIVLPQGVEVSLGAEVISVKGPLGAIKFAANPAVKVEKEGDTLVCKPIEGADNTVALSGTVRAVVANMVTGVSKGFERKLKLARWLLRFVPIVSLSLTRARVCDMPTK